MAGQPVITIEGDEQLTRALARLETKALRQLLPKAAKQASEIVVSHYKANVPVQTGIMRDSISKKVNRYKHKALTGKTATRGGKTFRVKRVVAEDIGASVQYDIKKIAKYAAKRGKKITEDRKRGGPFMYPFAVELGSRGHYGKRTLTHALYDQEDKLRAEYVKALRSLMAI